MSKLLPFLMFALAAAMVFLVMTRRPLLRGFSGESFISTGRPPLVVSPASGLHAVGGGVTDISPATASGTASARVWYALYAPSGNGQPTTDGRRLSVILAEAGDQWQWPHDVSSGLREVRVDTIELGGMPGKVATFTLPADRDPWASVWHEAAPVQGQAGDTLVYRFTFLPDMRRTKLVIEYREPVDSTSNGLPILEDVPALVAFARRAAEAFTLERPQQGKGPDVQTKLSTAHASLERRLLAKSLGELERRHGEQR
ncbi:DUF4851 domain-containing protein [Nitratidesulfovibrio vulgaris]|uniref:DUF4851 domain-containing protein n=1 Tax=Nitratidesulfovibrio vulgaris TaxID=881 RepID=UPI00230094B8|nr:DUF4851 domain-containing protein [Nitratidesulfovibrio vulgaris]WCB46184.1 DUF4851 domain-containing protein [Nitratidesulfovibrio vulgaris]